MKKFEAPTLEEAYAAAAKAFSCSITELEIQVVQNPSRGFLGLGKKPAVIVAACPAQERNRPKRGNAQEPEAEAAEPATPAMSEVSGAVEASEEAGAQTCEAPVGDVTEEIVAVVEEVIAEAPARREEEEAKASDKGPSESATAPLGRNDEIFDNFYNETPDIHAVVPEIGEKINDLFSHACFDIDRIEVAAYDEETVLVEFNGADAALLIGKEGYRYKALAYLLYNWIHGSYGFRVRLEIAEFLHNQETMIENYLEPIIERAEKEGRAQTKVLDGILVQIALKRLRDRFPDKYVAVRTNREGGRFIIINEFLEKR